MKSFLLKQSYEEGKPVRPVSAFTLDPRSTGPTHAGQGTTGQSASGSTQAQDRTVTDVAEANLQIAMAQLNKTNQDVNRPATAEQRRCPSRITTTRWPLNRRLKRMCRQQASQHIKVNQVASIQTAKQP